MCIRDRHLLSCSEGSKVVNLVSNVGFKSESCKHGHGSVRGRLAAHCKGKSQCLRMPVAEERTCSRYQASPRNTAHSITKMSQTEPMPVPSRLISANVIPTVFVNVARIEYCPSSHSPLHA